MRRLLTFFATNERAANHAVDRVEEVFATMTVLETLKAMTITATCLTLIPVLLLMFSVSDKSA